MERVAIRQRELTVKYNHDSIALGSKNQRIMVKTKNNLANYTVLLPEDAKNKLRELAARSNMGLSDYTRRVIEDAIRNGDIFVQRYDRVSTKTAED